MFPCNISLDRRVCPSKLLRSSFVLIVLLLRDICDAATIEFRRLKAFPCSGVYSPGGLHSEYLRFLRTRKNIEFEDGYVKADRDELSSFFLGPTKLVAEECQFDTEKCIIRGTIPVPIKSIMKDDIENSLLNAMKADKPIVFESWSNSVLTDRNGGVFDNMTPIFKKWDLPKAKKDLFELLKKKKLSGKYPSPYHAFIAALEEIGNVKVTGLLIEVAESINDVSLSLGAAILIAKKGTQEEWQLDTDNYKSLIREERKSSDAKIINCYMDELMGFHLATELPVIISQTLYERVCMDGLLWQRGANNDLYMRAPYFDSESDANNWRRSLEAARAKPAKEVRTVGEIKDATSFLRMRTSEKRACLRASGVYVLPRPREGPRKVDSIIIPLLDEEVAYEVLRRLGETRGDFRLASQMQDFESRKHVVAKQYAEARRAGNKSKAKELCDELNALATLRFDPSNPDDDAPSGGFDIEEWYWEQRKRIYSIIA